MDTNKIQHLQMILGIINRMASNSFALKGWTVTLVVGVYALFTEWIDEVSNSLKLSKATKTYISVVETFL